MNSIIAFFVSIKTFSMILHVLSVVMGMGGALIADLLFSFYTKDKKLRPSEIKTLALLSKVVWYSLLAIIISGSFVFLSDPAKYMASAKFLTKMSIIGVLTFNGVVLGNIVWPHVVARSFFFSPKEKFMRQLAFSCGAISVTSWIASCILGTMSKVPMTYSALMSIYLILILGAVSISLIVESLTFEKKKDLFIQK